MLNLALMLTRTVTQYIQFNNTARETTKSRVREKIYKASPKVCLAANVPTISFPTTNGCQAYCRSVLRFAFSICYWFGLKEM